MRPGDPGECRQMCSNTVLTDVFVLWYTVTDDGPLRTSIGVEGTLVTPTDVDGPLVTQTDVDVAMGHYCRC